MPRSSGACSRATRPSCRSCRARSRRSGDLAAAGLRLAVASSSNRELIDAVLRRLELTDVFAVTVSSEEVARGKPVAGRLSRGREAARRRAEAVRRGRGLGQRHPRRTCGGDARRRLSEPALSARGRRARPRRSCPREPRRSAGGSCPASRAIASERRRSRGPAGIEGQHPVGGPEVEVDPRRRAWSRRP